MGFKPYGGLSKLYPSEYQAWLSMKGRCSNPAHRAWKDYGGRGISICNRWIKNFKNFFDDMGPKPSPKYELDRIDNDGNYEPGNCRWATCKQQGRNRRNNRIITYNGESLCLKEWSDRTGIGWEILNGRLKRGWSIENTLTIPANLRKPHVTERSNTKKYTIKGRIQTLPNWCREFKISETLVRDRMRRGWGLEKSLSTPPGKYRRSSRSSV